MEQQYEGGLLRADTLPGQVLDGIYPWDITDDSVTLKFGRPEDAGAYLKQVVRLRIRHYEVGVNSPARTASHDHLQMRFLPTCSAGFTLTFLQHGGVRTLANR